MEYLKSFGIDTGDPQEEAFYGLVLVYNILFDRVSAYLKDWRLTPAQFNILMVVDKHGKEKGISQVDISKKLIVTPSNTTRLLEKMETEQLIVRSSLQGDRRVNLVRVTQKGSALLDKVWPGYKKTIQDAVEVLNGDDQRQAAALLLRWLSRLGV